jgi:hypothetical protein
MRVPRFRLRTLIVAIAFLALGLTVIRQTILLRQSMLREELLRALAAQDRAEAAQLRALLEANLQRFRAVVNETRPQVHQ